MYRTPADRRPRLPVLDRITVKSPCTASWDAMAGDGAVRFCCICSKNVYDLSAMSVASAEAFLEQHLGPDGDTDGSTCVRFFRRPDGRILTAECPRGQHGRHRRRAALTLVATLAATSLAVAATAQLTRPTLSEERAAWDDGAWDDGARGAGDTDYPRAQATMGAVVERGVDTDEEDLPPPIQIDEVGIADEAEPESELLGTAARTARAVATRRATLDPVIAGSVLLVRARKPSAICGD
jgi:hypothetical protein